MSGLAIFIGTPRDRMESFQSMMHALDTCTPEPRSWRVYKNPGLLMAVRDGIPGAQQGKTWAETSQFFAAVDGRLDNRDSLSRELFPHRENRHDITDAELALHLILRHGADSLNRLEGDFCIAVHDRRKGKLILARDPLGHRTLYYLKTPEGLACASRIGQFGRFLAGKAALDPVYLSEYLQLCTPGFLEGNRTPFKDLHRLLPGHALSIDLHDGDFKTFRYWDPNSVSTRSAINLEDEIGLFHEAFSSSVKSQVQGSPRIGISVSGGLDSSSIAILAQKHVPGDVELTGFNKVPKNIPPGYDESTWLNSLTDHTGIPIVKVRVDHLTQTQLEQRTHAEKQIHFDEPGSPVSLKAAERYISVVKSHSVPVLLYGFGEQFFHPMDDVMGRHREFQDALRGMDTDAALRMMRKELHRPVRFIKQRLFNLTALWLKHYARFPKLYAPIQKWRPDDIRSKELAGQTGGQECWPHRSRPRTVQEYRYHRAVAPSCETSGWWFACDRGLEWRYPMRSLPVLETILGCPSHILPGRQDRELLRLTMSDSLPAGILDRPKITVEGSVFYRYLSRTASALLKENAPLRIERLNLVNKDLLRNLMREVTRSRLVRHDIRTLYGALSLEIWLRKHPFIREI